MSQKLKYFLFFYQLQNREKQNNKSYEEKEVNQDIGSFFR